MLRYSRSKIYSYNVRESIWKVFFPIFFRDKGLDKDKALTEAAEATGIGERSIFCFLKQKLSGSRLRDNKSQFKNRLTVFEKLEVEEVDFIRHLVHDEMAKMRKQKGEPKDEKIEAEYLTYGNISLNLSTVFENHRKSLILHCERSELHLHFEWTKVH